MVGCCENFFSMSEVIEFKTVSADDFKMILKGEVREYVRDKEYLASIDISIPKAVVIENIIVIETIELYETDKGMKQAYRFPIIFRSGQFNFIIIHGGTFHGDIWIQGSDFKDHFWVAGGEFKRNVAIQGGVFHGPLKISGGEFKLNFSIQGGTFRQPFEIGNGIFRNDFRITNGTFENEFTITGGNFENEFQISGRAIFKRYFTIENGIFKNKFWISGGHFHYPFRILDGTFEKECWFLSGRFEGFVSIHGGKFHLLSFSFQGLFINYLHITSVVNAKYIWLQTDNRNAYELKHFMLDTLTLERETIMRIENLSINTIYFSGFVNFSNVVMSGVKFKAAHEYELKDLSHNELGNQIQINHTIESNSLQIYNSDLGKTTLIDCDFTGMKLDFRSSKITEVFLAGTKMPEEIITADDEQKQLGYAQLKKINESRGYLVAAHDYYSKEMNAYMATLKAKGGKRWERFNLLLNRISTNHGASWQRGLLSTLGVAGVFYFFYCISLGYLPASDWSGDALKNFFHCFASFFYFINPLHKNDFLVSYDELSDWANVIDGTSRIFIAFFIYQLIQAFRKHGKK